MRLARLRFFLLSAAFALRSLAAVVPLPDLPGVTDLAQFRMECDAAAAAILVAERTDQAAEATRLHAALWERYDAEVFSRRAEAADLSLATVNPWLTAAERAAATEKLALAATGLAELATFAMPDAATRDQFLAKTGRTVSEHDHQRARMHLLLQKIRNSTAINQLANHQLAGRRREIVSRLERLAAAAEPLGAAITDARDLPPASEAVGSLAANFGDPGAVESIFELTSESLALEATLSQLIVSDPANFAFWLARARGRLALGWRPGAVVDLTIASNFKPDDPGVLALGDRIRAVPHQVASIWQESVDFESVQILTAARRIREMAEEPPEELAPAFERTARAAVRNRSRRLYACSFSVKEATRLAALRLTDEQNSLMRLLFPVISPELGPQFQAEAKAAGNDTRAVFAVHHRYAPLFATTEAFWRRHVSLFIAAAQPVGARAALAVAETQFEDADWIEPARTRIDGMTPRPDAQK